MNAILWFIAWLITMMLPTNKELLKSKLRYFILFIIGLLCGLVSVLACTIDTYMVLWLVGLKIIVTAVEWLLVRLAYGEGSYDYGEKRDKGEKLYNRLLVLSLIVIILVSIFLVWNMGLMRTVNNANRFDQMVEFMSDDALLFNNEIPNNMLRLTTDTLAENIVRRSMSHFGSDVQILSTHITIHDGRLVWVTTIGSTNLWADNRIRGWVLVDANNPELEPEIIDQQYAVGEGLVFFPPFYQQNIQGNAYFGISSENAYGRAYITQNDKGEWKYVLTATTVEQWNFIEQPNGVLVYDEYGRLEKHYRMDEIPSWVSQMYEEDWIESMVSKWGGSRRGDGFDIWAGGLLWFITPSNDRVTITDDTRFVVSPDTNDMVALVCVDPIGEIETLSGIFKFSRDGIQYYDLRQYNIKSGHQAENVIESDLGLPNLGKYNALMPLLYPLGDTYAWFVPIYWEGTVESTHDTIRLAGLGIVQANNLDHRATVMTSEGFVGADLVAEAKRRFLGAEPTTPTPSETTTVNGTLTEKYTSVINGNKLYILTINQTDYFAYANNFDLPTIAKLERLEIGAYVSLEVNAENKIVLFN